VSDRFGDYGLVGIVSLEVRDGVARIVDFVLSCRVMGRQVEEVMVQLVQQHAGTRGLERVEARVLQTARNMPCLRFWRESGWHEQEDLLFVWTPGDRAAQPEGVDVSTVRTLEPTR
jgi:FkbH-like protein